MAFGDVADLVDLQDVVIPNFFKVVARLLGLAVFIMILSAGFQWLTATGDPKKVEQAKGTLTAAIGGILILIIGWYAINFLNEVIFNTGSSLNLTILDFCITPKCAN